MGSWESEFGRELHVVERIVREHRIEPEATVMLGGSFGGTLALVAALVQPRLGGVVLVSPLVDLGAHRERLSHLPDYRAWFDERFGRDELPLERLVLHSRVPVAAIQGDDDEVIDPTRVVAAGELARQNGRRWKLLLEDGVGHMPDTREAAERRYASILSALVTFLPVAPHPS